MVLLGGELHGALDGDAAKADDCDLSRVLRQRVKCEGAQRADGEEGGKQDREMITQEFLTD